MSPCISQLTSSSMPTEPSGPSHLQRWRPSSRRAFRTSVWKDEQFDDYETRAIRVFHPNQPPLRIVIQQGVFTICTRILDEHGGIIKTFGTPLH